MPETDTQQLSGRDEVAARDHTRQRMRLLAFAGVFLACGLIAGGYTLRAVARGASRHVTVQPGSTAERDALLAKPHLLFAEAPGDLLADRPLALARLDGPDGTRYHPGFTCQRVYMAAGEGLCLTLAHDAGKGSAFIFDAAFQVQHLVAATGLPSRARVSGDGRYGAMTFFVFGDAYAGAGQFSTRTTLVDMHTGAILAGLEEFVVHRNGQVFSAPDFNFWGVTFAKDSNHFYATLGTGNTTYLVEGDIAARELHTLAENVECPSLSPDNRRLVFKKRIAEAPTAWRLYALDLATLHETPLPETRSVDDQVEWLDDSHVLYTPVTQQIGVWVASVDGGEQPRRFATGVVSPVVLR